MTKLQIVLLIILIICCISKTQEADKSENINQEKQTSSTSELKDSSSATVNSKKLLQLNDENFESITNLSSLKSTESWFIFFDYKDDASNSIRLEISNLVDKTELNNVRVGIVDIKNSPCTVLRFNLSPRTFSLAYFKMTKDEQGVEIVKMHVYNGPKGHDKMHHFIQQGHLTQSKLIVDIEAPITFIECMKRQAKEIMNHATRHFNFIFKKFGLGDDAALQKVMSIYTGFAACVIVFVLIIVKIVRTIEGKNKAKEKAEENKTEESKELSKSSNSKVKVD